MNRLKLMTLRLTLLLAAPASLAQDGSGSSQDPIPGVAGGVAQTVLGLAAVLALIAVLAWLARRLNGRLQGRGGGVELLGGISLGTRERVVLVRVDDIRVLIGVAPGSVRALHVLDTEPRPAPAAGQSFATSLVAQHGAARSEA